MKTPSKFTLTLAALLSLAVAALAQIDGPPELIDYQGLVLDAQGDPIAQGSTENIEMYFRIWDHIADAQPPNLLWAEKQIVTVADGQFSVRLGEGDLIESSAGDNVVDPGNDDPRPSLLTVFDGNERFLGVSVAPNSTTKPQAEIQPRLAFLTTPFAAVAEKARVAEFGPSGGVFAADQIGVGTTSPTTSLHVANTAAINLLLQADTDDSGENDHPTLTFSQDGGNQTTSLGYFGGSDNFGIEMNGSRVLHTEADGDIGMGTTTPDGALHIVRPDADMARVLATGTDQGGGMFFAGQGPTYGGGFFYEGDDPGLPGDVDRTVFFRRFNGVDAEVFSYRYNSSNVYFTGRIGVGTTSPAQSIDVANSGNIRLNGGRLRIRAGEADGIQWYYTTNETFPTASIFHSSDTRLNVINGFGGVYLAQNSGSWTSASDARLKSDLEPLSGILDKIEGIRVVDYNMAAIRPDPKTGKIKFDRNRPPRKTKSGNTIKHEIGTVAQDWMEHFPELVTEPENEDDHYGLAYDRVGVVAIGAAQELSQIVKRHEAEIRERDDKIAALEARMAKLEALLSNSEATPPAAE